MQFYKTCVNYLIGLDCLLTGGIDFAFLTNVNKIISSIFLIFFTISAIFICTAQADDGIEYYGTITSINYNQMTFIAAGRTFKAYPYTEIEAEHGPYLTFCYLQVGHIVEVKGWPRSDYVDATKIEIKNYNGTGCNAANTVTVKGNISLIDTNASTIVVKNYTIKISNSTKFKGNASNISELYMNQLVKVKGKLQTNGIINATSIKAW